MKNLHRIAATMLFVLAAAPSAVPAQTANNAMQVKATDTLASSCAPCQFSCVLICKKGDGCDRICPKGMQLSSSEVQQIRGISAQQK